MSFMALAKKKTMFLTLPFASNKLLPLFFSSTSGGFRIQHYLVSTFGFSHRKAHEISKRIAHLRSPERPQAVQRFLKRHGFDESQIKTIITRCGEILNSSVEDTLAPNLCALRNSGLSTSSLNQIIVSDPVALLNSEAVPRINYWRDFVAGDEAALVNAFTSNRNLISRDLKGRVAAKIPLLQNHGISTDEIRKILCTTRKLLTSSARDIDENVMCVKELDFQPCVWTFLSGLHALNGVSREVVEKKKELFKSLGCSEDEFLSVVQKFPAILSLSEEDLRAKMDFLLGEVGCDISYITSHPSLLFYCLEKRLRPRHHVVQLLESNNISEGRRDFLGVMRFTESRFVETYIRPYKKANPELYETYLAASTSAS